LRGCELSELLTVEILLKGDGLSLTLLLQGDSLPLTLLLPGDCLALPFHFKSGFFELQIVQLVFSGALNRA
jgi:hypothetical protein